MKKHGKRCLALLLALFLLGTVLPNAQAADTYGYTNTAAEARLWQFLREELGLNDAAACGVLANVFCESSFNPTASVLDVNNKTSYGLFQWNGGRFTALRSYCEQNGLGYSSVEGQLAFLRTEISGSESAAWAQMQGLENSVWGAYQAGYNWAKYFERCSASQHNNRARMAAIFYKRYVGGDDWRLLFFEPNGGSCAQSVYLLSPGQDYGALPTPTWGSNSFLGWYTQAQGGSQVTGGSASFGESLVLYARWNSAESFAKRLYQTCLGREAESAGLAYWTQRLNTGLSGREAAWGFVFSLEYSLKQSGNADYVSMLYRTLLGREPESGGHSYWVNRLNGGYSRESVFHGFCNSVEFSNLCALWGIRPR